MDHDQRFKTLIQVFFTEFLQLFFAAWAARLRQRDGGLARQGGVPRPAGRAATQCSTWSARWRRVKRCPAERPEPEQFLALVHIEIESPDKAAPLRPRMFRSYVHWRGNTACRFCRSRLYLKVGLDGLGVDVYEEHFWELRPVRFEFLYVGLPGLDAVQYVQGDNWLGVALAALMRIPKDRIAWLGAEALRRLQRRL